MSPIFFGNIANMIPESPLNKMVPLTEDHGGRGGGARGPPLAHGLIPTTVVQGIDNHVWGLYGRHCYCICVCWGCCSRIFHFSRWLGQLSTVLTKGESPHTGYTFPLGRCFCSPNTRQEGPRFYVLSIWQWRAMRTSLGIETEQADSCSVSEPGTQLEPPIQVLALSDDRLSLS